MISLSVYLNERPCCRHGHEKSKATSVKEEPPKSDANHLSKCHHPIISCIVLAKNRIPEGLRARPRALDTPRRGESSLLCWVIQFDCLRPQQFVPAHHAFLYQLCRVQLYGYGDVVDDGFKFIAL